MENEELFIKLKKEFPYIPEMNFIKGGVFNMGTDGGYSSEQPIHKVTISSFYMSKYLITYDQFIYFLNDIKCDSNGRYNKKKLLDMKTEYSAIDYNAGKFYFKESESASDIQCPVVFVTWFGGSEYCKWLSKNTGRRWRLPTEAEYEYAAGGGAAHQKWAGTNSEDELSDYAWFADNSEGKSHKVGLKKPNLFNLYDMSGNVWAWCNDWTGDYSLIPKIILLVLLLEQIELIEEVDGVITLMGIE